MLNTKRLLRALHGAGMGYVIVGGFVVNAHGVIQPSNDLQTNEIPT